MFHFAEHRRLYASYNGSRSVVALRGAESVRSMQRTFIHIHTWFLLSLSARATTPLPSTSPDKSGLQVAGHLFNLAPLSWLHASVVDCSFNLPIGGSTYASSYPSLLRWAAKRRGEQKPEMHCHLKPSPDMDVTLKTLNRAMDQDEENNGFFLFADSVNSRYEGPSETPVRRGSSADYPFSGKMPQECQTLLKEVRGNSPQLDIGTRFFAILDNRSDDSVLLVDDDNEDFGTVTVAFELAMELLMCHVSGHRSVKENNESPKRGHDGVLRDY